MDWWIYPIAILGGLAAGFINTLAGNGSAITLTILMEFMGLPPNVANASNRVGIAAQSSVSTYMFYKNGKIDLKNSVPFIIVMFIGAMIGLYTALKISNENFRFIFGILMIVMLIAILINPKKWIKKQEKNKEISLLITLPVFLLLGFYGGFIQMGMGIIFLAFAVLVAQYDIISANGLKILCVGIYTFVVLGIFAYNGLVDWKAGGLISIGQVLGAWWSSKIATEHPLAAVIAHRVLVAVVIFAIIKVFFF